MTVIGWAVIRRQSVWAKEVDPYASSFILNIHSPDLRLPEDGSHGGAFGPFCVFPYL